MRTTNHRKAARPKLSLVATIRSPKVSLTAEPLLRDHAERALTDYFANLNGHRPAHLYDLVLREVEEPLVRKAMDYAGGNQTKTAIILGITRATLRKKLREFGLSA
jgi:Fis family transcriptional regulator, factor for inversion stimulation protein